MSGLYSSHLKDSIHRISALLISLSSGALRVVAAVFLAVADSVQWIDFKVQDKWSDMLQILLVTAYSFYFGGRSFEKLKTKF